VKELQNKKDTSLIKFWKWKCEQCGHEFALTLMELPKPCHRCGGEWFLKIGESERKEVKPASALLAMAAILAE